VALTGRQRLYASPECSRQTSLVKLYALTLADWRVIFAAQGWVCAICKRAPRTGETFHVDHEHTKGQTGRVRGILCNYCNTRLIGRLKDHAMAQNMADYLRDPPAIRALGREVIAPGRPKKRRSSTKRPRNKKA
jgi:hypothetical protein